MYSETGGFLLENVKPENDTEMECHFLLGVYLYIMY